MTRADAEMVEQSREFRSAVGSGFGHCVVDVALNRAHRQIQPKRDVPVGHRRAEEHHDLAFTIGQRQLLGGLPKRRCARAAADSRQRLRARRAAQRRPAEVLPAEADRGVRGRTTAPMRSPIDSNCSETATSSSPSPDRSDSANRAAVAARGPSTRSCRSCRRQAVDVSPNWVAV